MENRKTERGTKRYLPTLSIPYGDYENDWKKWVANWAMKLISMFSFVSSGLPPPNLTLIGNDDFFTNLVGSWCFRVVADISARLNRKKKKKKHIFEYSYVFIYNTSIHFVLSLLPPFLPSRVFVSRTCVKLSRAIDFTAVYIQAVLVPGRVG